MIPKDRILLDSRRSVYVTLEKQNDQSKTVPRIAPFKIRWFQKTIDFYALMWNSLFQILEGILWNTP